MKTFLQFTEDIEIMSSVPKNWSLPPAPISFDEFMDRYQGKWSEPHRLAKDAGFSGFELWKSEGAIDELKFIIVDRYGNVAGFIEAEGYRDRIQISKTELHRQYQGKGSNIITSAYKELANYYNIQSSSLQSAGGASVWKRLINDPELGGRLYLRDREGNMERLKYGTKDEEIWAWANIDREKKPESKTMPKYSRETKANRKRVERTYGLTIVIKRA